MTRKRYADTLDAIATHGVDAFYTGRIANATVEALRAKGGVMTMGDLEGYRVEVRRPSEIEYRGKWRLVGGSAPSSGGVVLSVMKIVEGFEMGSRELGDLGEETHLLDEAVKFGYGMVSSITLAHWICLLSFVFYLLAI